MRFLSQLGHELRNHNSPDLLSYLCPGFVLCALNDIRLYNGPVPDINVKHELLTERPADHLYEIVRVWSRQASALCWLGPDSSAVVVVVCCRKR